MGLDYTDLFEPETSSDPTKTIVATYDYKATDGTLLYQAVRFQPKGFRQRRPNPAGPDKWVWNMAALKHKKVPYRLPDLVGHSTIYCVEGEKDVDALWAIGVPATCNIGGAGKWSLQETNWLKDLGVGLVIVIPDNDTAGQSHAELVASSVRSAGIAVKVVKLPDLPPHGDVSDWLSSGHTVAELQALVETPVPAAGGTPDLRLTAIGDFLAEPDEQVEYIVEGCIAASTVNGLTAKPKVGKSTAARHLAVEVARGGSWLGRKCRPGAVWYVAFEGRRADIRNHFRQLGATKADPIRIFIGRAPAAVVKKLAELAIRERPALIIIDTMQRFIRAKDASDYAELTLLLDDVIAIARDSDAAILLLHHANKSGRAGARSRSKRSRSRRLTPPQR
jgi:hypothetical protein